VVTAVASVVLFLDCPGMARVCPVRRWSSCASSMERSVLWAKLVARAPSFAKYQAKVEAQIPMAVLTPTR